MIYVQSILKVSDNTGATLVQCIKVFKGPFAKIGDVILVSIKRCKANKKIKKGQIYKAVLLKTKKKVQRIDGKSILFNYNTVALIKEDLVPLGKRIKGSLPSEFRKYKYNKFLSISEKKLIF